MLGRIPEESKEASHDFSSDDELTSEMVCPISKEPFDRCDFLVGDDGHIYEAKYITHWVQTHRTSPITRAPLNISEPSPTIKRVITEIIKEYREKLGEWHSKVKTAEKKLSEVTELLQKQTLELIKAKTELNQIKKISPIVDLTMPPGVLTKSFLNSRFLSAVRQADIPKAICYLKQGADSHARDPETGENALALAIEARKIASASARSMLLMLCDEYKVNIDNQDCEGYTPLHQAALRNDVWATEFLISRQANPILVNKFGQTPRRIAQQTNKDLFNPKINTLLVNAESRYFALHPISSVASAMAFFGPSGRDSRMTDVSRREVGYTGQNLSTPSLGRQIPS